MEPEYVYKKGEGWVCRTIETLEGLSCNSERFRVIARNPEPGEYFMRRDRPEFGPQCEPNLKRFKEEISLFSKENFRKWDHADRIAHKTIVTIEWL